MENIVRVSNRKQVIYTPPLWQRPDQPKPEKIRCSRQPPPVNIPSVPVIPQPLAPKRRGRPPKPLKSIAKETDAISTPTNSDQNREEKRSVVLTKGFFIPPIKMRTQILKINTLAHELKSQRELLDSNIKKMSPPLVSKQIPPQCQMSNSSSDLGSDDSTVKPLVNIPSVPVIPQPLAPKRRGRPPKHLKNIAKEIDAISTPTNSDQNREEKPSVVLWKGYFIPPIKMRTEMLKINTLAHDLKSQRELLDSNIQKMSPPLASQQTPPQCQMSESSSDSGSDDSSSNSDSDSEKNGPVNKQSRLSTTNNQTRNQTSAINNLKN